jgi:hypothetical protein
MNTLAAGVHRRFLLRLFAYCYQFFRERISAKWSSHGVQEVPSTAIIPLILSLFELLGLGLVLEHFNFHCRSN